MNSNPSPLDIFIRSVQSRLNRLCLSRSFVFGLLVGAALATLTALVFIAFGHSVPAKVYWLSGGAALLVTAAAWFWKRQTKDDAARFADRFFGLKDTISSAIHFEREAKEGAFVELQAESASDAVASIDAKSIPFQLPRRILTTALILTLVAGSLAFKKPSQAVLDQMRMEAETLTRTDEINEYLKELVEDLEETMDEVQREVLDTDSIRRAIKELEETEDRREAMRQYAELERRLREAAQRLEQRRNEQLMSRVGEELQKDPENRGMGKQLEQKQYREAASELSKMQEQLNEQNRSVSQQHKDLARLKAASMRMAAAAKAANRKGSTSSNSANQSQSQSSSQKSGTGSKGGNASEGQNSSGGSEGGGEDMETLLSQINQAAQDLDGNLEKAEREMQQSGKVSDKTSGDCKACQSSLSQKLDQLNQSLCKMGAKSQSRQQLLSMCRSLGQCQGYLGGQCQSQSLSQSLSQSPGQGKGIGNGSVESRREGGDEFAQSGEMTQLQGQKGDGPSTSQVQAAESGDGVSSRRTGNQQREFQKQMESFVQREDIPDEVKEGVKRYFTRIHESSEQ
ncbi:MAG: hypothetical protein AAGF67_16610 [Verrucomicrobiota bacterium]